MKRVALPLGVGLLLFAASALDAQAASSKLKKLAAKDPANAVLVDRDAKFRADATSQAGPRTQDHCLSRF